MERKSFRLKKIHVEEKKSKRKTISTVVISYNMTGEDKLHEITCHVKPHPDMDVALRALRPIMAEILEQPESEENQHLISGFTLSELKNGAEQVLICSNYSLKSTQKIAINSPNIMIDGEDWEHNASLHGIIKKVADEAWEYVFNNKAAQLDLVNEIEKIESGDETSESSVNESGELEMVVEEPKTKKGKK